MQHRQQKATQNQKLEISQHTAGQTLQDFSELQRNDIYHLFQYIPFPYLFWRVLVLRQRVHFCLRHKGRLLRSKRAMRLEISKYVTTVDKRCLLLTQYFIIEVDGRRIGFIAGSAGCRARIIAGGADSVTLGCLFAWCRNCWHCAICWQTFFYGRAVKVVQYHGVMHCMEFWKGCADICALNAVILALDTGGNTSFWRVHCEFVV